MAGSTFKGNTAHPENQVTSSTLVQRRVFVGRGGGLAVYMGEDDPVIITVMGCTFINNSAIARGGGVYIFLDGKLSGHTFLMADSLLEGKIASCFIFVFMTLRDIYITYRNIVCTRHQPGITLTPCTASSSNSIIYVSRQRSLYWPALSIYTSLYTYFGSDLYTGLLRQLCTSFSSTALFGCIVQSIVHCTAPI